MHVNVRGGVCITVYTFTSMVSVVPPLVLSDEIINNMRKLWKIMLSLNF